MGIFQRSFFFIGLFVSLSAAGQSYWIDTDIMTGKFSKDVDDGIALIMLLEADEVDEVDIAGINLVNDVEYGEKVTRKILKWRATKEIPVFRGASTSGELGKETPASRALAEALKKEKLKIAGLGPATNIATVLKLHPELASQIDEIVFCKGRRPNEIFQVGESDKYLMDYNLEWDAEAMRIVLRSGVPVTLAGFPVAKGVQLKKEDLKPMKKGPEGNRWLFRQFRDWLFCWKLVFGTDYFIPFDGVTVGYFLHPEYFEIEKDTKAKVVIAPNDTDFKSDDTPEKPYLYVSDTLQNPFRVNYVSSVDSSYIREILRPLMGKSDE
jgi:pyrimidine-specific ribonucleoside hydrolase